MRSVSHIAIPRHVSRCLQREHPIAKGGCVIVEIRFINDEATYPLF